jgi:hypothetical protein
MPPPAGPVRGRALLIGLGLLILPIAAASLDPQLGGLRPWLLNFFDE